jgi:hypothetical protein
VGGLARTRVDFHAAEGISGAYQSMVQARWMFGFIVTGFSAFICGYIAWSLRAGIPNGSVLDSRGNSGGNALSSEEARTVEPSGGEKVSDNENIGAPFIVTVPPYVSPYRRPPKFGFTPGLPSFHFNFGWPNVRAASVFTPMRRPEAREREASTVVPIESGAWSYSPSIIAGWASSEYVTREIRRASSGAISQQGRGVLSFRGLPVLIVVNGVPAENTLGAGSH